MVFFLDASLLSSFDSSASTNSAVAQSVYEWQAPQAGVYDNAWGDLDTTPHTWTYGEPVSIEPEGYYAGLAQTNASTSLCYDGTCNPMPGWEPSFNPQTGGGCTLNPMYGQPGKLIPISLRVGSALLGADSASSGLGSGAAYGSGVPALAPPALAPVEGMAPASSASARAAKAGPGHLLLMSHAMLLGALTATTKACTGSEEGKSWADNFREASTAAADAVTPVGGKLLRDQLQH